MPKTYSVYIVTDKPYGTIYLGMTNDIARRAYEHKHKLYKGFTQKYSLTMLVYVEHYNDVRDAIALEKQMKKWNREWKINRIKEMNPEWKDLYEVLL